MDKAAGATALAAVSMFMLVTAGNAEGLRIDWPDLIPAGEKVPSSQKITSTPSAETRDIALATRFSGKKVRLSGYLLPADREGDLVYSFILVPRNGACSHMTQPPASQVVRVIPEKPYRLSMNYEPVSVTGALETGVEKTQLFILDGVAVIESGYKIGMAAVAPNPAAIPNRPATPWSFLDKPASD